MFVPAAIRGGIPKSRRKERRIVPRARPTAPPRIPTAKDKTVKKVACQTKTSDGMPKDVSGSFISLGPRCILQSFKNFEPLMNTHREKS